MTNPATDAVALGEYLLDIYPRPECVLERGGGVWLYDSEGSKYLDFTSGIGVNALGQAHPAVVAAVKRQVETLGHVSNLYHTAPAARLAEALCTKTDFADRVFFANSGSEAIETAIKFARKHARRLHGPGKTEIIAFRGSFHGRTTGAVSLTAKEAYQAPFRPLLPDVTFLPFNDVAAAREAIGPQTCAVVVEPVQGEGGLWVSDQAFLETLRDCCDRSGALLVFDEIQCGMGRTGKLWAHENYGIAPDILASAKALGGGLPLSATLLTADVAESIVPGDHGSTFGGGPVACAAALAAFEVISADETLRHVREVTSVLEEALRKLPHPPIVEIRGMGLMLGVELDRDVAPVLEAAHKRGLLVLSAGPRVLRLLPPLTIGTEEVELGCALLGEVLVALGGAG